MRTILIVDADTQTAQGVKEEVTRRGHVATVTHDGAATLRHLDETVPSVVFLAIDQPQVHPEIIVGRLRNNPRYARTRLVLQLGLRTKMDLIMLAALGVSDFFTRGLLDVREIVDRLLM
jgi:DNA-binding response OmpR family regulator